MTSKQNGPEKSNSGSTPPEYLEDTALIVKSLIMSAMAAGNEGDFKSAFSDMEVALWFSRSMDMKCMEAVLLNNQGLLHSMSGAWDKGMLYFDRAMEMAIESCPSNDAFLTTIRKNILALLTPKPSTSGDANSKDEG